MIMIEQMHVELSKRGTSRVITARYVEGGKNLAKEFVGDENTPWSQVPGFREFLSETGADNPKPKAKSKV
jgi:hypothetical protein